MTIHVFRPYPFREPVGPSLTRALRKLKIRFETRLTRETEAIVTLLALRVDDRLLARLPKLRIVANVAVGYDNVDVAAAARRGVLVTNTPDVLTEATADLAWALLLAAARRVVEGDRYVRSGKFRRWGYELLRGKDVAGKTLGIIGAGRIGQAVGRRATGFSMKILYASRGRKPEFERGAGARRAGLEALLRKSDFVSIHVPLMSETRHLIGARELALMKRTAILVNTARGPIVDEAALVRGLRAGRPAGAGLDVYEREPKVHPGLLKLDNVVLLPHLGSATDETRRGMYETALRNVVAFFQGRRPPNIVNPEVFKRYCPGLPHFDWMGGHSRMCVATSRSGRSSLIRAGCVT